MTREQLKIKADNAKEAFIAYRAERERECSDVRIATKAKVLALYNTYTEALDAWEYYEA